MKYRSIVILIAMSLFLPSTVSACRCKTPNFKTAYEQASMVVFANVQDAIIAPSGEGSTAILTINQWWKSKSPVRIVVNTLSSCSYHWEVGNNYLLFLNLESNGIYSTGLCAGNEMLEFSNKYTKELLKLGQSSKDKK